ncbi:MAG: hypothetical protein GXN99_03290 [Candidatus Nanohaloarchaeota archaeon]|nr:hypothetical protein [Candidatus Nanohaloarchaeota archaeon]
MKVLYWHVDYIKYKAVSKALKSAPDIAKKEDELQEGIVVLISLESHDNENTIEMLVSDLIKYAEQIKSQKIMFYPYAHLSNNLLPPAKSLQLINVLKNHETLKTSFKEVKFSPFGWYKSFEVKVKGHPLAELSRSF